MGSSSPFATRWSPNVLTSEILDVTARALREDLGSGDATTNAIVPRLAHMEGVIIARQEGVAAGLHVAEMVYRQLDADITFSVAVSDGARVAAGAELASVSGPARAILTAERTALNFIGRMSGIATLTRRFVDAVAGTRAVILDTRKTAPGLRTIDKLAVRLGGGQNHRAGLYDMILIKDNHIDFAGSLVEAVRRARAAAGELEIEVEARTLADVSQALELGVRRILLDNMALEMMREAVKLAGGRAVLEASGNVRLDTVRQVAETGVDYISVGALTHSAPNLDVSFDYVGPDARA